jgi:hypothetical protein
MSSDCKNRNPLQRSGVNQYQRVLQALLPDAVKIDDRDYADLILFAKNYGGQLKYFNSGNVADGDWQSLMSMDASVTLASLIKSDTQGSFVYVKDVFATIQRTDTLAVADLQRYFKVLFDFAFSVTKILNDYYKALPVDFEFRDVLGNLIQSNFPEYYSRLKKYYDEAIVQGIVDPSSTFSLKPYPLPILLSQNFNESDLVDRWFDSAIPSFTPTFNGASIALKVKNTSTHNLFTGIFDQYLKSFAKIVELSSKYLDRTLSSFPIHTPHYALYLTFIKLFRFSQNHVNQFSKRHLDLYYKEILKLSNKNAQPDKVHLTFELAKTVKENHPLKKDTIFKAGKDIDGEEIFYALTEDVVLNKGTVKSLKSVFVDNDTSTNSKQLLANPITNSEDGLGAKIESVDKSWKVFGDKNRSAAEVGFVVSSNYLYLQEGVRTITFKFYAPEGESIGFIASDIQNLFSLQLTGKKGWIDVKIESSGIAVTPEYFSIVITLNGGVPSVVPYSQKLHEYNFNTVLPVAKFLINGAKAKESVWNFSFDKIDIGVSVSGMKDLAIQNDTGSLNASKPFDFFGSAPHVGSSFILGNKEIFMKTLQPIGNVSVKLNITWDNYAELIDKISTGNNYTVDVYHLEDAVWKLTHQNKKLFIGNNLGGFTPDFGLELQGAQFNMISNQVLTLQNNFVISESSVSPSSEFGFIETPILHFNFLKQTTPLSISLPPLDVEADFTENENYAVKSVWGYLKIELNSPEFGHSSYAKDLADAAREAKITTTDNGDGTTSTKVTIEEIAEPYTPKVKEISVDYTATTSIDFASGEEGKFIHITPFGSRDTTRDADKNLLPQADNEGEFFIGLENFKTEQTLSILFQVAEGSADPLTVKQELSWYYLGDSNEWIAFKKEDIADATNDLTQSGIIKFNISDEAVLNNTLMTEQLHWLRATIAEKSNAVCKLIEVKAQAARAQLKDHKESGIYYKNVLPANTISKSLISDAALKKISQPYASFGGRAKEGDDHFYVRVSERLRHKNRAIAMWDYERMVLEAYPSIYKVKCINHTQILEKTSGTQTIYTDNELKPGYVLVVPIPDLQNKNAYDPLRPYTSLGLLTEIRKYLYGFISPHVNLDVRNPRFEEIQLEFKIKYITEDNDFYTKQLKEEIEQYLAPWAYDPQTDIEFGGKISKSVLIDFIEERSYVDFLSCVKMYQIVEGVKSADVDEVNASSARSVFVSVKSDDVLNTHKISFITDECDC